MPWIQLSVEASGDRIEEVVNALERMGSQATTQQNAGEDSYFDLAHPAEPMWDKQTVTGLFDDSGNPEGLFGQLMDAVPFVKNIELIKLEDQNWETAWLDQYQPIQITPELWVYPSWVESENHIRTVIKIDPGMAFGTGTHETTRLCMQILADLNLKNRSVLDYGCGSGILAITALKLGADTAVGVDIDPKAETVSRENAHNNGVDSRFAIQSALDIETRVFGVVIANILASALIDLAPTLVAHVKENGSLILSGVLDHQTDDVIAAYQPYFIFERFESVGWVALLGQKTSNASHE